MNQSKKPVVVAVSGGFDPIHPGHVRYFKEAKALGDKLVVILNNDNWLRAKKKYSFMSEKERKEVIEAIRWVDEVVITKHPKDPTDMGVSEALRRGRARHFFHRGDGKQKEGKKPGSTLCKK